MEISLWAGRVKEDRAGLSGISLVLSGVWMQDVGSERLEHTGTNTEPGPGPWKGQNGQPVNGVLSRYDLQYKQFSLVHPCFPAGSDGAGGPDPFVLPPLVDRMSDGPDAKYQQPAAHDGTCVAARTRPLVSCRRRRLIQPSTVPNLNGKVGL